MEKMKNNCWATSCWLWFDLAHLAPAPATTVTLPPHKAAYEMFSVFQELLHARTARQFSQWYFIHLHGAICFLACPSETHAFMHFIREIRAQGQQKVLNLALEDSYNVYLKDISIGMTTFAMCILTYLYLFFFLFYFHMLLVFIPESSSAGDTE